LSSSISFAIELVVGISAGLVTDRALGRLTGRVVTHGRKPGVAVLFPRAEPGARRGVYRRPRRRIPYLVLVDQALSDWCTLGARPRTERRSVTATRAATGSMRPPRQLVRRDWPRMSCGTRQPRSPSVLGRTWRPVQRMLGRASAAVTLDRYADLLDDDLTWWRTGWTLWRAWRANFLRTV